MAEFKLPDVGEGLTEAEIVTWKVKEGDTVAIRESMKMEMPVEAEDSGTVKEILCEEGQAVNEGDTLVVLE